MNLYYTYTFNSYLTENTACFPYKDQLPSALQENNDCLL